MSELDDWKARALASEASVEAAEALADEWDGAADHGEDERHGRIVSRILRLCATELRASLGACKECGGSGLLGTKHFDEYPAEVRVCDFCAGRGA